MPSDSTDMCVYVLMCYTAGDLCWSVHFPAPRGTATQPKPSAFSPYSPTPWPFEKEPSFPWACLPPPWLCGCDWGWGAVELEVVTWHTANWKASPQLKVTGVCLKTHWRSTSLGPLKTSHLQLRWADNTVCSGSKQSRKTLDLQTTVLLSLSATP